ncbi:hypothetical protein PRIPAC_74944 [Pristionchus pacificus]|uniref:ADP-ribosylhydrolase ARH3 n=1 Tax=Pristionchus pacificus TaxID=54126 RepID=A0A454XP81_PRIPA|nr:hypothetical protein PRIPAC_74944 [Pristionchus pacificus]|eukprot:PDM83826.1 hypothetical protein PRIPAC_30313 [Pristionchus pacificus]
MSSPLNRALGILYGQFIGDALGSRYEFKSAKMVKSKLEADRNLSGLVPLLGGGPFGYGPGVVTDDGEMAMSLLSSSLSTASNNNLHHDLFDSSTVACSYARWAQTNPPDIGNTCRSALSLPLSKNVLRDWPQKLSREERDEIRKFVEENVKRKNNSSLSNGSLMRQSVLVPIYGSHYFRGTRERTDEISGGSDFSLLSAAESDTILTHSNPLAIEASKAYALILFNLLKGKTPEDAVKSTLSVISSKFLQSLLESARIRPIPVETPDGQKSNGDDTHIGFFGVSLQVAVHYLLHASSFSSGLIDVVSIGGDTDTNAAIAGALLGARFGLDGIPSEWSRSVEKAPLRMKGENGIESFEQLIDGVKKIYDE